MAGDGAWAACGHWHELLDMLCAEQGYLDNMALAEQLCAAQGNQTQAAFDAAVKSLRNWRQGIHMPQRRNFLLLTKILKVDRNDDLRVHWNRLYGEAKVRRTPEAAPRDAVAMDAAAPAVRARWPVIAGGGLMVVAAAALSAIHLGRGERETFIDPAASLEGIQAEYVRNVTVQVGDAVIIHGARGNDCGDAPSWESASVLLPRLVTGTLSDGGVGTRFSRRCGGRIPARAILFTARVPGTEQTSLYGDEIHIRVTN
ncbi:MAG: hypothetical protein DCC69_03370 [Hyphomicrobiales bacterium]|nr:MAG: hypothetical protein DCC69_03370 [Hyphomicrobiales bacterium]